MTKEIKLFSGETALVDDEDYPHLVERSWIFTKGYARHYPTGGHPVYMHVEIMKPPPGMEVDHRDGNKLNNQKLNLRICTHQQNRGNTRKPINQPNRFKGVTKRKNFNRYQAQITVKGKRIYLGLFEKEIDAARAYDRAATQHFGEFAKVNVYE